MYLWVRGRSATSYSATLFLILVFLKFFLIVPLFTISTKDIFFFLLVAQPQNLKDIPLLTIIIKILYPSFSISMLALYLTVCLCLHCLILRLF